VVLPEGPGDVWREGDFSGVGAFEKEVVAGPGERALGAGDGGARGDNGAALRAVVGVRGDSADDMTKCVKIRRETRVEAPTHIIAALIVPNPLT